MFSLVLCPTNGLKIIISHFFLLPRQLYIHNQKLRIFPVDFAGTLVISSQKCLPDLSCTPMGQALWTILHSVTYPEQIWRIPSLALPPFSFPAFMLWSPCQYSTLYLTGYSQTGEHRALFMKGTWVSVSVSDFFILRLCKSMSETYALLKPEIDKAHEVTLCCCWSPRTLGNKVKHDILSFNLLFLAEVHKVTDRMHLKLELRRNIFSKGSYWQEIPHLKG